MASYSRLKKRLLVSRITLATVLVAFIVFVTVLFFPRYRIVGIPEYVISEDETIYTVSACPIFTYKDDSAMDYCDKLVRKYMDKVDADAIEINIFESNKDVDSWDSLIISSRYYLKVGQLPD